MTATVAVVGAACEPDRVEAARDFLRKLNVGVVLDPAAAQVAVVLLTPREMLTYEGGAVPIFSTENIHPNMPDGAMHEASDRAACVVAHGMAETWGDPMLALPVVGEPLVGEPFPDADPYAGHAETCRIFGPGGHGEFCDCGKDVIATDAEEAKAAPKPKARRVK